MGQRRLSRMKQTQTSFDMDAFRSKAAAAHRGGVSRVLWLTGLSGAGKSTIARQVVERLKSQGESVVFLDGDEVRAAVADTHVGHDRESRFVNAMRMCRLAKLISDQGVTVVVATVSMFREVYSWNRTHLNNYFEIYVRVNLELLKLRDARGLYSRAERGEVLNVVGIHLPCEEPPYPDLVLTNEGSESATALLAEQIVMEAEKHILSRAVS